eukprot:COSAG02_NODE_18536_length_933_cov_5.962830_1_plen_150_part_00
MRELALDETTALSVAAGRVPVAVGCCGRWAVVAERPRAPRSDLCERVGVEGDGRSVPVAAAELHSCSAADTTVEGLAADGWEWSTTFGLRRAAIALAKENNGLDDGLYHLPLQGCGVPDLSNAETAQAQLNRRVMGGVVIATISSAPRL